MRSAGRLLVAGLTVLFSHFALDLRAEPITLNGITFSDEAGGFVLVDGWGSGTQADPFVIVEQVTDTAPAVLVVRDFSAAFGNPTRTQHLAGFVITKVVINATDTAWQSYDLQLQEQLGQDSTYGDGLSFGQNPTSVRSFASDLYRDTIATDEPLDGVTFRQGIVRPGERVAFSFFVTDNTPQPLFYLVQSREQPVVMLPDRPESRSSEMMPPGNAAQLGSAAKLRHFRSICSIAGQCSAAAVAERIADRRGPSISDHR